VLRRSGGSLQEPNKTVKHHSSQHRSVPDCPFPSYRSRLPIEISTETLDSASALQKADLPDRVAANGHEPAETSHPSSAGIEENGKELLLKTRGIIALSYQMEIRTKKDGDEKGLWNILQPVVRAGDTYALPRDWSRDDALRYWCAPGHQVWVAEEDERIIGSYFLQANQLGGGDHVANAGFATHPEATGLGVATALCTHALSLATSLGFRAMQFNFVVSTNERAVALWKKFGFGIAGTLPKAFRHPTRGFVDVYVMYREL